MNWFYRDGMNTLENSSIMRVERPTIHKNMEESIVLETGVGSALAKIKQQNQIRLIEIMTENC